MRLSDAPSLPWSIFSWVLHPCSVTSFFLGQHVGQHAILWWPPVILPGERQSVHFSYCGRLRRENIYGFRNGSMFSSAGVPSCLNIEKTGYSRLSVNSPAKDPHRESTGAALHLHFSLFRLVPHSGHKPEHSSQHKGFIGTAVSTYWRTTSAMSRTCWSSR